MSYFNQKKQLSGPVFSVDVECVAIGKTHDVSDRYPALVALVDSSANLVYKQYIRMPENTKIWSYLTPLSGIRPTDYSNNRSSLLQEVQKELKSKIPRNAVLVGQRIESDIDWMGLKQGTDFANHVDLAEIFCSYNQKFRNMAYHSLIHEANVVLGASVSYRDEHDPGKDAEMSVLLWNKVLSSPASLSQWQKDLIRIRPGPSPVKIYNGAIDGVCISKFNPNLCRCGLQ